MMPEAYADLEGAVGRVAMAAGDLESVLVLVHQRVIGDAGVEAVWKRSSGRSLDDLTAWSRTVKRLVDQGFASEQAARVATEVADFVAEARSFLDRRHELLHAGWFLDFDEGRRPVKRAFNKRDRKPLPTDTWTLDSLTRELQVCAANAIGLLHRAADYVRTEEEINLENRRSEG